MTSTEPIQDGTGLYYVSFTSTDGRFWERWFNTYATAEHWLQDMESTYG